MLIPFDKYYPGIIEANRERMKRNAEKLLKLLKAKHQKDAEKEALKKENLSSNVSEQE